MYDRYIPKVPGIISRRLKYVNYRTYILGVKNKILGNLRDIEGA
jgi:hypothetical protein